MPSSAEHQAKYQANRTFLDSGTGGAPLSTVDPAWAAIVAFYAALHLVDRLAALTNLHPQDHGKRLQFVARHYKAIFGNHNDLKTASEVARYGTVNQFNRAFPGDTVQTVLIDTNLVATEQYVAAVFAPPAPPGGAAGAAGS